MKDLKGRFIMKSGYEVFQPLIDKNIGAINAGETVMLEIKDCQTFTRLLVKAKVSKSKEQLNNAHDLWIVGSTEVPYADPWAIEIIEELDDDDVRLEYPHSEGTIGLYGNVMSQKDEGK
jgi:hypothetical protein